MADNQRHITPTAELIRQYLEGKLDGKTMHALEKQALDDPFLAEALEGYAKYPADQQSAMSELQQRLQERVAPADKKVRRLDYRWLAAASVLLILCISAVMILNRNEKQPEIAQVTPVIADSVKVQPDTATIAFNNNIAEEKKAQPAADNVQSALDKPAAADFAKEKKATPPGNAQPALEKPVADITLAKRATPQPALEKSAPPALRPAIVASRQSSPQIMIRGIASAKDSGALVLVDGLPAKLDSLNPADIADVSVLKDAAASALYGAKAANGVVLVTTVKGKKAADRRYGAAFKLPGSTDSTFALSGASSNKIDTIYIGGLGKKPLAGALDSKVEGLVTGAKSNFSNYYTDDNVRKISGVVVDEKTGKKIPGVAITINGTNRAVTDTAGSFALQIAAKDKAELAFSSIGYEKKNVTVPLSTSNLNVALPASNAQLNETVVVGYGSKAKKSLESPPYPLIGDEAYSIYLVTIKTVEIPGLKVPVSGSVHISFSVMPDRTLQDFKVLQGLGKTADSIAIQHVKEGPKWMPASNNKKATVKVLVPVELVKKKPD